jgi:hypothetical protein
MSFTGQIFDLGNNYTYEIGIYKDRKLIPDERVDVSNTINQGYLYRVDNETAFPTAIIGLHPWDNFNTDIDMGQAVALNPWKQPHFGFPFDRVRINISLESTLI